ncbi:hypothetical protein ACFVMC_00400 [Nocardia sp. NPDC127579]|uniref:hypothetical protein n=1 Tax=Nocardia sp. NPDC127579 TaxID=3345402 RepID=UPI0036452979
MIQRQVRADQLPNHIGSYVLGQGVLTSATVVPDGDIVLVQFGKGFSLKESTFAPEETVTIETEN